ncbi:MAG: isochorismatase family cysteine hydrolase [Candidatus Nanoarchaeia archaeon]|jgi:nicotinamidase-related amidase
MNKTGLAGIVLALGTGCGSAAISQEQVFANHLVQLRQANNAVLVIDMQESFLNELDPEEKEEEIPYQIEVLNAAKRNNIPIFVIEYEGMGSTIDELMNVISTSDYEIVTKPGNNGFRRTNLDELLKEKGIHSLTLMGVFASACVYATAGGALQSGYEILTSTEVIADSDSTYSTTNHNNQSAEWYAEHGTLFDNHDQIVNYLDRQW